jgi:hypothetical protein
MADGSHFRAGEFDRKQRWYPKDEFWVPGTFQVCNPSRLFPWSYLKHFYTKAYSQKLFAHNPKLWLDINQVDLETEDGQQLFALAAAQRIGAQVIE